MTLLRDLIEIPQSAAGDIFVLNLQDGVKDDHAAQTLREYVITPAIADRFDEALGLIAASLGVDAANRPVGRAESRAAFLHGSFGSGKSHFMAILHLLLQGHAAALARPELAKVVEKHRAWMKGRKFLLVASHLIGASTVEAAVYENYAETVAALHPEAALPDLHDHDAIFAAAAAQREMLGETAFFERLNAGADPSWGDFASAGDYSAASYERCVDGFDGPEERRRLAELVGLRVLPGQVVVEGRHAPFNEGLERISEHAKGLGYDAVVLFLDEFVLWLASRAGAPGFVAEQMEKAVKLVDADHAARPAPIVSFIARQRSLQELIAASTGSAEASLEATMSFHEARFQTIELKGTELPEIVSRRLLRPKDPTAAAALKQSFEQTIGSKPDLAATLSGDTATQEDFAKVYPFSPVLVEALMQAASMLQRDRTALKAMLQILVARRETLELGELLPAGDLYDVVKEGRDAISDHFRQRFSAAKAIYEQKFLPLLERTHGTTEAAIRLKPWDDPARRQWRRDDRLFKTILIAALVPSVRAFRDLTPGSLARLNHGSVRSLVPGQEAAEVLRVLLRWAGSITELTLSGDEANPTVALAISGVDVDSVIHAAQSHDTHDARRQLLKRLVYESLGIEDHGAETSLAHEWRGTERKASIVFQNVGSMTTAMLCNDDESWKVVIDYPIDEAEVAVAVAADRQRIAEFLEQGHTGRTIVWRPRFLNQNATRDLGRLAVLERLASRSEFEQASRHLSLEEREAAWPMIESQRNSLRQRVRGALQVAYGLSNEANAAAMINEAVDVGEHFVSLDPNLSIRPPGTAELRKGLLEVFEQALESQFPAAPRWDRVIRPAEIRTALDAVRSALANTGHRAQLGQDGLRLMKRFADPLELGETGSAFLLKTRWKEHFDREAKQAGLASPTVADLRRWMDQPKPRGLPRAVQDLLILTYADQSERAIHRGGTPLAEVTLGGLREDDRLVLTPLPSQQVWAAALERASELFGIAGDGMMPTSAHLAGLAQKVREAIGVGRDRLIDRVDRVLDVLTPRWTAHEIVDGERERELVAGRTALEAIGRAAPDDRSLIEAIAAVDVEQVHGQAMGTAIKSAAEVAAAVEGANWALLEGACLKDATIRAEIRTLLEGSERLRCLRDGLRELERRATRVVTEPVSPPPPPTSPQPETSIAMPTDSGTAGSGAVARRLRSEADLAEVVESIRAILRDGEALVEWSRVEPSERDGR